MKNKFSRVSPRAYKKLEVKFQKERCEFDQLYQYLIQEIIKLNRENRELKDRERLILSENSHLQEQLELKDKDAYKHRHDPLTGLGNKLSFNESIEKLKSYWEKVKNDAKLKGREITYEECVCIAFIDMDDLKQINDTFGHPGGDAVIKIFAQRLSMCIRESDAAFRLYAGGDEFVILMPHSSRESAIKANRRFGRLFSSFPLDVQLEKDGVEKVHNLELKSSVGFLTVPLSEVNDPEKLIESADAKMYKKKRRKKSAKK